MIADDHPAFRSFVAGVLSDHYADLLTVAAACSVSALGATWTQHQPVLVLLDIGLPGLTNLGLIAELRAAGYRGWIIILSMEDDPPYVTAALAAGADALLGKGSLNSTLRPTIARLCHPQATTGTAAPPRESR